MLLMFGLFVTQFVIKRWSVRLSVRPSVPSIDSSSSSGGDEFAAEVGRGQQISTDSSCCRATCGPHKFWSDYKEVQLLLESGFLLSGKVPNSLKFGI